MGAEVFGEVFFHLGRGFEGHGVEVLVEFGDEAEAVFADGPGGFVAVLVVFEAMLDGEAGHSDIQAGFGGVALGVEAEDGGVQGHGVVEEDDVDVMMMLLGHVLLHAAASLAVQPAQGTVSLFTMKSQMSA